MALFPRLLPRSLYGRAALILIVPIVAIQLVVSTAFIQRHYEGVTRQMTQGVAIDLEFLLEEVAKGTTPGEARTRAIAIAGPLELKVMLPAGPDAPVEDQRGAFDLSGGVIIDTLRAKLPDLMAADVTDPERMVNLRFESRHGPVQVKLDRRRMAATNPHQLLVLMIFTSVLMTVISYAFLRNQLRPITRLAEAAKDFGKGRAVTYRPRGALEVRAAGRAFLDMRARIERQIEQRTLMLSGVSHDLRTPLTRLKLGLSLMPEDDDVKALLADVTQMERMVDEFLSFARGDAMEQMIAVDAVELVSGVVAAAGRGGGVVTLAVVEGRVSPVMMRPQAVTRAVENLIGNAQRFGRRVEVSLQFSDTALRIAVEDDGPGIPPDQRDEAMRPFSRLDSARDPNRGGGVGLGLSIAADVAMSHGGMLRLLHSDRLGGLKAELQIAR
ncbi:MAG: ATP-binding protein [Tabrizicola sp.]|uniref:ATP-binding protein n=1 Tax=Tabrizicola sp. TaxID=2005166 RepID=UPI002735C07B|nr:ATP-binding protein [Tabrizicola sp.]MDP3264627.1 ATP-binding protein [Tabrizicola sp.]MDP3647693.1 ATP-binding protein [Paracoccaceae bacterium]MDZ4069683.1 ATP-binding protein [Tabrizicola sp.]